MKTKLNKSENRNKSSASFFTQQNGTGFISGQAKMKVGEPGDKYEIEADKMAENVINRTQTENKTFFSPAHTPAQFKTGIDVQEKPMTDFMNPLVQRQPVEEEEEEMIQTQPVEEEEELMPKAERKINEPDLLVEQFIRNSKGAGNPLDSGIRSQMENGFGADFSGVKIHNNNTAVQLNNKLKSHAFTTGNDIFFNEGKYRPETTNGKRLLAHELTHTIQQRASSKQNQLQKWPWSRTPEEELADAKREFRSHNYGPLTYTRPDISGSGFEASYWPMSSRLNITVRGKIRFADTLSGSVGSLASPNIFMNQSNFIKIINKLPADVQSRIMPYFRWTDAQKQIHLMRFRQNLEVVREMWQGTGMSFQVNETGWDDVTATPNITFTIGEGDAIHQTRSGGFLNLFTVTDESTSDHLQIEMVKQLSNDEADEIIAIITAHNADTGSTVDRGMIQSTRSYMHNDPGTRGSAPQGFNNIMSMESNLVGDPSTQIYATDVYFGNDQSDLSESSTTHLDNFFSDPMILLDNGENPIRVSLRGFASAPASTSYNRTLVDNRIISVENYINNHLMNTELTTNVYTSESANDADTSAEADLAANPESHDPSDFRRVEITITREGRGGQNTLAHEFGHIFGLGDEYAEVGGMYDRPANSAANHDTLARNAGVTGGATVANDQRMMSEGNVFGAAHYSTFADALNQLTSKRWKIVT